MPGGPVDYACLSQHFLLLSLTSTSPLAVAWSLNLFPHTPTFSPHLFIFLSIAWASSSDRPQIGLPGPGLEGDVGLFALPLFHWHLPVFMPPSSGGYFYLLYGCVAFPSLAAGCVPDTALLLQSSLDFLARLFLLSQLSSQHHASSSACICLRAYPTSSLSSYLSSPSCFPGPVGSAPSTSLRAGPMVVHALPPPSLAALLPHYCLSSLPLPTTRLTLLPCPGTMTRRAPSLSLSYMYSREKHLFGVTLLVWHIYGGRQEGHSSPDENKSVV